MELFINIDLQSSLEIPANDNLITSHQGQNGQKYQVSERKKGTWDFGIVQYVWG